MIGLGERRDLLMLLQLKQFLGQNASHACSVTNLLLPGRHCKRDYFLWLPPRRRCANPCSFSLREAGRGGIMFEEPKKEAPAFSRRPRHGHGGGSRQASTHSSTRPARRQGWGGCSCWLRTSTHRPSSQSAG
jgi:hypothetical protein